MTNHKTRADNDYYRCGFACCRSCRYSYFSEIPRWSKLLIFAVPYIVLGLNVILDAVHGLAGKQFLDEKFLMSVASVGALAVGEYAEAVLVMLLYRLGELLQSIAVGKAGVRLPTLWTFVRRVRSLRLLTE